MAGEKRGAQRYRFESRKAQKKGIVFRKDPIPGTGHSHCKYARYFRTKIRTIQEKREYFKHPEFVRKKRSFKYLPDSYESLRNITMRTRSWKRTKKEKQWM